jgi:hypothetical protein
VNKSLRSTLIALVIVSGAAACGSDDDAVGSAVTDAASDVGGALDSTADSITDDETDDTGVAEGAARPAAEAMVVALMTMPDGGEPTIANLEAAMSSAPAGIQVTGVEDDDGDGTDDDAKATVEAEGGDDKACMQHQDGAWEVTDDEC